LEFPQKRGRFELPIDSIEAQDRIDDARGDATRFFSGLSASSEMEFWVVLLERQHRRDVVTVVGAVSKPSRIGASTRSFVAVFAERSHPPLDISP
jgi:hypothetical protein